MHYISTRGETAPMAFQDAVMTGLAPDGGLLLPEEIPEVDEAELDAWRDLEYPQLAAAVMRPFVDLSDEDLEDLVERSYESFREPEVAPVVPVGPLYMLELFHGPTLAFKDVALQFLGNLFALILETRRQQLNIIAATSGDTGSAAIHGVRGKPNIRIFVMHPHGRTSPMQALQMTSVLDENVHNLAVHGTFDDCQSMLKTVFSDGVFKRRYALGAVNSINWARILAQVVYYFYAAFRVMEQESADRVRFCVPTGNFGDIFAGYIAARMGLPIDRLVLASNENDILYRFFDQGLYARGDVSPTLSPSMDIQVASNFERYLYYRLGEDGGAVARLMQTFADTGAIALPADIAPETLFAAGRGDTADTLKAIRSCYEDHGYLLDPHSAVGYSVARRFLHDDVPMICLATAHPAKFGDAVRQATGRDLAHHPVLDALADLPTRCEELPADAAALRAFIEAHAEACA